MAAGGVLDLNSATFDELCSIPGVGPALARKIVELRQQRGSFTSLTELLEVEGLTPGLLDRLRSHVAVAEDAPAGPTQPEDESKPDEESHLEPTSESVPDSPPSMEEMPSQGAPEPALATPATGGSESRSGDGDRESSATSPERLARPDPAREPVAPPRLDSLLDDEEEWPRSYGGVSSSILFGEAEPVPESTTPPYRSRSARSSLGAGRLILLVVLSGLLGSALSLAGLAALNGTLYYVSRDRMGLEIAGRLDSLEAEAAALNARLDRTTGRLGSTEAQIESVNAALLELDTSLAAVGVRVAELEGLRDQVESTVSQVGMLAADIDGLQGDLDEVSASADRFEGFLEALRGALADTTSG